MTARVRKIVTQIAAEADATADEPLPGDAEAIKPNRSVTVSTRLGPDDVAAIDAIAARLGVPAASLLRGWILAGLTAQREESIQAALDRLTADVQRLRELVA